MHHLTGLAPKPAAQALGEYTLRDMDYADTGRPLYAAVRVATPCFASPNLPSSAKMLPISARRLLVVVVVRGARLEGHPA